MRTIRKTVYDTHESTRKSQIRRRIYKKKMALAYKVRNIFMVSAIAVAIVTIIAVVIANRDWAIERDAKKVAIDPNPTVVSTVQSASVNIKSPPPVIEAQTLLYKEEAGLIRYGCIEKITNEKAEAIDIKEATTNYSAKSNKYIESSVEEVSEETETSIATETEIEENECEEIETCEEISEPESSVVETEENECEEIETCEEISEQESSVVETEEDECEEESTEEPSTTGYQYTEEDYEYLLMVIVGEAQNCSREHQLYVGSVVLNRLHNDKYFLYATCVKDIALAKGQYSCFSDGNAYREPTDLNKEVARELIENGSKLPVNVIFQSQFRQGDGVYIQLGNTYFCYKD